MTQEEKSTKIAEHLGWKVYRNHDPVEASVLGPVTSYPPGGDFMRPIPRYFEDLNVCHEALKTLDDERYAKYRWWLWRVAAPFEPENSTARNIVYPKKGLPYTATRGRRYNEATAAQRSEAFGISLGLWKDGE